MSCDRLHCNDTIGPCDDCPHRALFEVADQAVRVMNEIRPDSDDETWERHGQAADELEEALEYDLDDHEASNAS